MISNISDKRDWTPRTPSKYPKLQVLTEQKETSEFAFILGEKLHLKLKVVFILNEIH